MRVLLGWLKELVHVDAGADEVARRLTMAGLEVEAVERLDAGLDRVVVGEIRSREGVPGTHLSVCRVFDGTEELQVVCGAPNCDAGARVPLAKVGAVLPGGMEIRRAKLRGIESFGMLCSAKELGGADASGLLHLPADSAPGEPVAKVLGRDDVALEVNVTPNRADALSHLGIARDLAALFGVPVRRPETSVPDDGREVPARIDVEAPDGCGRYVGRVLEGVEIRPSPAWLQRRIEALGQRPINNVVDATNLVMLETGQPLHAFDLDRLAGARIRVRRAAEGEPFRTLDGKDHVLSAEDLVIADASRPVALAGVMGGEDSEVKPDTRRLLLESAYFAPSTVRRSARRHAVHSESSHRFERGVDAEGTRYAIDRLATVILQTAGGRPVGGAVDVQPRPWRRAQVALRRTRLNALLGTEVPWDDARRLLAGLGLVETRGDGESATYEIPGFRGDLTLEADLGEEVARLRGFETIPARAPGGGGTDASEPPEHEATERVRAALAACGFDEAVNFAFVAREDLARVDPDGAPIALRNPIAADQAVMRTTLVPGLLRSLGRNLRHGAPSVRLFETGRAYLPPATPPSVPEHDPRFRVSDERARLALVAQGARARGWFAGKDALDFWDLKGAVEAVLEATGVADATVVHAPGGAWLHPRSATAVPREGTEWGRFGEIHPALADAWELPRTTLVGELDMEAILAAARIVPVFKGVPRFPATLRDVAVVVAESAQADDVRAEIRRADPAGLVEEALLFDVYRGTQVPEGRKNLAFSLRYRAPDRTLTDDEVGALHAAIVARLERTFGAALRA